MEEEIYKQQIKNFAENVGILRDQLKTAAELLKRAYELNKEDMGFDVDVTEFLELIGYPLN